MNRYRTIVADPPWEVAQRTPWGGIGSWGGPSVPHVLPYRTMTLDAIRALPVDSLADDVAHLYVWTTNAFLEQTYALVRGWRFRPSQVLTWAKTPRGLGLGGAFTNTTEFVLFAWRGKHTPLQREDSSWWNWKRGEHSAKPEAFLDMVERVSPAPRLEMFSRRARLGWDTWGDESLGHVEMATA